MWSPARPNVVQVVALVVGALVVTGCKSRTSSRARPPYAGVAPLGGGVGVAPPSGGVGNGSPMTCGAQSCRSDTQSCCEGGGQAACVANVPVGPNDGTQLLGSQIDACQGPSVDIQVQHIARCRSSSHCGPTETCCEESLFGGAMVSLCRPSGQVCEYSEACVEGTACKTPGSVCSLGRCVNARPISCGTVACSPATHACVWSQSVNALQCVPKQTIAGVSFAPPQVGCTQAADCLPGERCHSNLGGGTVCSRGNGGGNMPVLCNSPQDCPTDACWVPGTQPTCGFDAQLWHKTCVCK